MSQSLTAIVAEDLGVFLVKGKDALTFLQGQATPDFRKLHSGNSVFGAFCNAQGRVISNGWFQALDDGFRLIISRDLVPQMIKRLRMYVLRSNVKITDVSDEIPLWLLKNGSVNSPNGWLFKGTYGVNFSAIPTEDFPTDGVALRGDALWLFLIQAGIPLVVSATSEKYIPHMLAMDKLGGLSFEKGCYTGQEIVTRTQFLGKVKRTLHHIASDVSPVVHPGTAIMEVETTDTVGEVFSCVALPNGGAVGLAVTKDFDGASNHLVIEGHPFVATPLH